MVNPATTRRLVFRGLFLLTCFALIFISMLPLSTVPSAYPGPDLIYAVIAAFVLRRPRYAPLSLIVLVLFVGDLLYLRPLGLWPAIALIGFEFLRSESYRDGEMPLSLELILVPVVFAVMIGLNALVYFVFSIPHPTLGQTLIHILMTAMAYPFVIGATEFILRVRRPRPGEIEPDGT